MQTITRGDRQLVSCLLRDVYSKRLRFRRPLYCRHGTGASFFTSRDKLRTVKKEKKKNKSNQTSNNAHPAQAPEGKTSGNRGRDHHHSLYSRSPKAGPPSLRTVRESKKLHSKAQRISGHRPGRNQWLLYGPKKRTTP